ncbi:MAG: YibE/F family protein [Candidatus Choladocola sp.]|nr:YibE/F family protein [Candidatus Choladocola sp.]
MKHLFSKGRAAVYVSALLLIILLLIPTGYEDAVNYKDKIKCAAEVVATNNDSIIDTGLVRSGEQTCIVRMREGKFRGQEAEAYNLLNGSLENDKIFEVGDVAQVVITYQGDEIQSVNMIDHFRITKEIVLAALFILVLIGVAGKTGIRAILSFAVTVLMIWKILIPLYLKGYQPVLIGFLITGILTVIIISLVYGYERRTLAAVCGSMAGLLVTAVTGALFTDIFRIHGAIMPYSESLLYSGYANLNLTQIFMASIFIGSSGAVMDLSVDITSAVYEVICKKPDITWKEAARSGMNVGRAAMGTMTTTLLLAYSGGYVTLLMVFMAQGTPVVNILNYKYVASEILDTIVGSMGLVTVAPLTALCAGWLLTRSKKDQEDRISTSLK